MTAILSILFICTLFLNAFLLFFVQPMFAKMIMPLLGGSPQVWNTCMVFFQAALLGGYAYAHWQAKDAKLPAGRIVFHLGLMALAFAVLPIRQSSWLQAEPPVDINPIPWLLQLLVLSVGLPFFMASTGAPLLQNWFSRTKHKDARDPYFLYAASNLGSLISLLAYPFFFEPRFTLHEQSRIWTWGYACLIVLTAACSLLAEKQKRTDGNSYADRKETAGKISRTDRLFWIVLAFIPSSWMLGVTTYVSTDIAAIPLLWIIPLSIYLLSFVIGFSQKGGGAVRFSAWIYPIVLTPLIVMNHLEQPAWLLMPWNLLCFLAASTMLHGELASRRPAASHLTEFYFWIAVGGVLGGIFNALIAPFLFNSIFEYSLMLIAGCFFRRMEEAPREPKDKILDAAMPVCLGILVIGLTRLAFVILPEQALLGKLASALYSTIPVLFCFSFRYHRVRFALGVAVYILTSTFMNLHQGQRLHAARTFFGVHRVSYESKENRNTLIHGKTVHGYQSLNPEMRAEPLGYYHHASPIGQVMEKRKVPSRIGFVGLGAGALAAYGQAGEKWTFFEIDPEVKRIAENSEYFTYLKDSKAGMEVVLGDARLSLQKQPDASFDVLVIDAFSSDSIPVHLITREAVELYLRKLKPDGLLTFHISNRYLDLEPVVGGIAEQLHLMAYVQYSQQPPEREKKGYSSSRWMLLTRDAKDFEKMNLAADGWLEARSGSFWTDHFSNILSVYRPEFNWNPLRAFTSQKSEKS